MHRDKTPAVTNLARALQVVDRATYDWLTSTDFSPKAEGFKALRGAIAAAETALDAYEDAWEPRVLHFTRMLMGDTAADAASEGRAWMRYGGRISKVLDITDEVVDKTITYGLIVGRPAQLAIAEQCAPRAKEGVRGEYSTRAWLVTQEVIET